MNRDPSKYSHVHRESSRQWEQPVQRLCGRTVLDIFGEQIESQWGWRAKGDEVQEVDRLAADYVGLLIMERISKCLKDSNRITATCCLEGTEVQSHSPTTTNALTFMQLIIAAAEHLLCARHYANCFTHMISTHSL